MPSSAGSRNGSPVLTVPSVEGEEKEKGALLAAVVGTAVVTVAAYACRWSAEEEVEGEEELVAVATAAASRLRPCIGPPNRLPVRGAIRSEAAAGCEGCATGSGGCRGPVGGRPGGLGESPKGSRQMPCGPPRQLRLNQKAASRRSRAISARAIGIDA